MNEVITIGIQGGSEFQACWHYLKKSFPSRWRVRSDLETYLRARTRHPWQRGPRSHVAHRRSRQAALQLWINTTALVVKSIKNHYLGNSESVMTNLAWTLEASFNMSPLSRSLT